VAKVKSQPSCPWERDLVPALQEAGRASRPAWTAAAHVAPGAAHVAPTGIIYFFQNILKFINKKIAAAQHLVG